MRPIQRLVWRQEGQALYEHALVLTLVVLVAVAALTAIGLGIVGFLEPVANAFGG